MGKKLRFDVGAMKGDLSTGLGLLWASVQLRETGECLWVRERGATVDASAVPGAPWLHVSARTIP